MPPARFPAVAALDRANIIPEPSTTRVLTVQCGVFLLSFSGDCALGWIPFGRRRQGSIHHTRHASSMLKTATIHIIAIPTEIEVVGHRRRRPCGVPAGDQVHDKEYNLLRGVISTGPPVLCPSGCACVAALRRSAHYSVLRTTAEHK